MGKKTAIVESWLSKSIVNNLKASATRGRLYFNGKNKFEVPKDLAKSLTEWQKTRTETALAVFTFESSDGPVWIVSPYLVTEKKSGLKTDPYVEPSPFAKVRDACGLAMAQIQKSGVTALEVFAPTNKDDLRAMLIGFEMASYRYKPAKEPKPFSLLFGSAIDKSLVKEAELAGWATNVARHFVNLPPNELSPSSFATLAKQLLAGCTNVDVEVWIADRLKKERMNLLLAVGQAAADQSCLLHLRYRPGKKSQPIALVGKGITFDSGGLDIKPSSGMRLMKKDMGGGAAVLGAFCWAAWSKCPQAIDAYIPLAENAVGANAFRPGDVYISRNGQTVEIHNTDAEGRLVLVDAMDVALSQKGANEPSVLVNVATLTGAIKVSLGSQMPGLFSNHLPLSNELRDAFWKGGDPVWPMPLIQKYRTSMVSNFADMTNAVDGFGGAVTAALFLESFVKDKPWAHFDIYAWKDSADGAIAEAGGSGQAVQGLIQWLRGRNRP